MRAVNLLPPDRKVSRTAAAPVAEPRKALLISCAVLGVVVVAGLSTAIWSSTTSISSKKTQLDALEAQIASIPSPTSPAAGSSADTSARAQAIAGIVGDRLQWDHFLNTLSKVVPEDVWLQNLSVSTAGAAALLAQQQAATAAAAAAAAAATSTASGSLTPSAPTVPAVAAPTANVFTVSGYTYSHNSVARLMRRLDIVPWLADVSLVTSTKSAIGPTTVFQFTVKGTVVPTPSAG
jgi:Tfp pilus assembly protein PilN